MPRGDGTGPMGQGSMTGRGAGFCAGSAAPGFASSGLGFGRGRGWGGRGGGWGRRNMFYATGRTGWQREMDMPAPATEQPPVQPVPPAAAVPPADVQQQLLETQLRAIQSQLDEAIQRLAALEAAKTE